MTKHLLISFLLIALIFPIAHKLVPYSYFNPHKYGTMEWATKQHELLNGFEKHEPITLAALAGFFQHIAPLSQTHVFSFDGVNDYITFGDVLDLDVSEATTVSFFLYRTSTQSDKDIISKLDASSPNKGWMIGYKGANTLRFWLCNTDASNQIEIAMTDTVPLNTWVLVTMTKPVSNAASEINFYFDTTLKSTTVISNNLTGTTVHSGPLDIGRRSYNASYLTGYLTGVAKWGRVLNIAEIFELYKSKFMGLNVKTLSTANNLQFCLDANPPSTTGTDGVSDPCGGYKGTLTNGAAIIPNRGPF